MSRSVRTPCGFTLIELMIVIAIIGVLATLAMPSFQDQLIRTQAQEALVLATVAEGAVQDYYKRRGALPRDNSAAGLPPPEKFIGNYVTRTEVVDGAVTVTFGNRVNRHIRGKTLSIRPAIVDGYPIVPIAWLCGTAAAPNGMRVSGRNHTTLANEHLPLDCRR